MDFGEFLSPEMKAKHKHTTYDLVANVVHDGDPKKGTYRVHVLQKVFVILYFLFLWFESPTSLGNRQMVRNARFACHRGFTTDDNLDWGIHSGKQDKFKISLCKILLNYSRSTSFVEMTAKCLRRDFKSCSLPSDLRYNKQLLSFT